MNGKYLKHAIML